MSWGHGLHHHQLLPTLRISSRDSAASLPVRKLWQRGLHARVMSTMGRQRASSLPIVPGHHQTLGGGRPTAFLDLSTKD